MTATTSTTNSTKVFIRDAWDIIFVEISENEMNNFDPSSGENLPDKKIVSTEYFEAVGSKESTKKYYSERSVKKLIEKNTILESVCRHLLEAITTSNHSKLGETINDLKGAVAI